MFEIQTTLELYLELSPGREIINTLEEYNENFDVEAINLFPLITGKGAYAILSLYNSARTTVDIDFKILGLTKIIEFVAPTVAREELNEKVKLKLSSKEVFCPDAKYILELNEIYNEYSKKTNKNNELIKATILRIIDVKDISGSIPNYMSSKSKNKQESNDSNMELLKKVAKNICDTRNEIAHAKANYEKKGGECPIEQKNVFCEMLDIIAIKCIRWFAMQSEDKRVII